jgi:sugar lactone lactonase YvrE
MNQLISRRFFSGSGICAIALFLAPCAFGYSPNDVIATYAGNGTSGYSGDGGPAAAATLNTPSDIAVDSAGNLYISDPGSSTIRKVSTSGIITTIAGTGVAGYNGDGILASTAQLNNARGITFDSADDLYIADTANNRIRKITFSTGLISTVAGTGANGCGDNLAAQAVFSGPVGVALDPSGILYISDTGNHIVRKLSGGMVTSIGGTCSQPQSVYESPQGLVTDSAGNVYVDVTGLYSFVLKFDSSGNATQFAGNGTNGNTGDGSAANSAGVTIYQPYGIARDAVGNIFIGSGTVVRVVTPDGIIHTSAGNGTNGSSGDGSLATSAELKLAQGLAVNAAGRLFVVDQPGLDVRIVGPVAPLLVKTAGNGLSAYLIISADNRINCSSCGANYVQGMPVILSAVSVTRYVDSLYQWSGACQGSANPCTVIAQAGTNTAVARLTPWYIQTVAGRGATSTQLMNPLGLALASNGNLYFSETGDCVVRMLSSGRLTTIAGNGVCGDIGDGMSATEAELNFPEGLAVDSEGNLYIQDGGNAKLRKVTTDGILHTLSANIVETQAPGLVVDMTDTVYVIGNGNTIVEAAPTGTISIFATVDPSFGQLEGLAVENSGELVAGVSANSSQDTSNIFAVTSADADNWIYIGAIAQGVIGHTLNYGFASSDRATTYFVLDCAIDFAIRAIVPTTCSGYSDAPLIANTAAVNDPAGIVIANRTRLYVADSGNNAVRVIYADAIFSGDMDQ